MRYSSIVPILCFLSLITACRTVENGPGDLDCASSGKAPVTVSFHIEDVCYSTRSASVSDESGIRDLNLFLYRNGKLEWQEYRTSSDAVCLDLLAGENYVAYVLANVGRQEGPAAVAGIHDYVLDLSETELHGKAPMATASGVAFTVPQAGTTGEVGLVLKRLLAKYNFRVDCSALQFGSFAVESVRVRQAARRINAFLSDSAVSAADQVADGDYASANDLDRLNAGNPVCFYLPENAQGTLLPGNTDPWRKEYFEPSLAQFAGLCTYLEVKGHYRDHSGGLDATHTYRMFLGEDATTNFDVLRNTEYTLTLSVSDLGVFRESWKVERGNVTDSRQLYFDPPQVDIPSLGSGVTAVVSHPSGVDYTLEWDTAAFAAASLSDPVVSGGGITLSNEAELSSDATVLLRAVSYDGAVQAVCTLQVRAGALPPLEPYWIGSAPAYVAQAGRVGIDGVTAGNTLSAVSSDPSVARLVRDGDGYRVEALKEGSASLTFTLSEGSRTRSGSLQVEVAPVYLQVAGQSYRAFADGATNAVRIDGGGQQTWALSYNLPRSAFDADLYAELLTPCHTAVKSGTSAGVDYFEVSEDGLYVASWGNDMANLPGSYTVALRPQAEIYASAREPLRRTVVVDAPLSLSASSVFAGENRYYMPDPGTTLSLLCSGTGSASLGDPSSLKICVGYYGGGYREGSGQLVCPYAWIADGSYARLCLTPTYEALLGAFPEPFRFRGFALHVFGRMTNARSGRTYDFDLGGTEIWLALAVTARLASWGSRSDWDITDEDHYFLVPCLYDERFSAGLITFQSSQTTGDLREPPYYIPRNLLTGIPDRTELDGATILLSEERPMHQTGPAWQVADRTYGLRCPDITNWLWDEAGWSEEDYERDPYQALSGSVGGWYHKKLYWRLCDTRSTPATIIEDGGHLDIRDYGGFTGNYYLRLYDYAEPLDPSDFDE